MMKRWLFFLIINLGMHAAYADEPWYAGPLLSEPAIVTPVGHGYVELYLYKIMSYGAYDEFFDFDSLPMAKTGEIDWTFNYGISQDAEVQLFMTYLQNETQGQRGENLGDTTVTIARQVMLQNGRKWPPNIKIMFRETFPTGHYSLLSGGSFGTQATGQGAYLSQLAVNMEHVMSIGFGHHLVSYATFAFIYPSLIDLQGNSIYGGSPFTRGKIWPGKSLTFNLALEYFPNQKLGFILETFILTQEASHFRGNIGPLEPRFLFGRGGRDGRVRQVIANRLRQTLQNLGPFQDGIGHGNIDEFTLAPGIDYAFNKDNFLSVGVWFTVAGKNTPAFYAPMLRYTGKW